MKIRSVGHGLFHEDGWTDRQTDGWTDRQTDGQTDVQTDGQTDKHDEVNSLLSQFYYIDSVL